MRWRRGRRSANVEDRRGGGFRGASGGVKLSGGVILLALVASFLLGENPLQILGSMGGGQTSSAPQSRQPANRGNDEAADFVSVVLADTEDTWSDLFRSAGQRYQAPKLVLYSDGVQSACGMNSAASGPFYCPGDSKVYLDLSFLRELQKFGAHGDFAVAYVIAHEIGHHVQNLVGTSRKIRQLQMRSSKREANALSVLVELQADCFAGVWANHAHRQRNILEQGDVEEGLNAAASVGDDRMLRMAGRRVHPDAFTHGSSKQRTQWFRLGLKTGDLDTCNTFAQVSR